jgi:hypothetical protein
VRIRADLDAGATDFSFLGTDRNGDGQFTENPLGIATFGPHRGHDHILFWREVYQ